MKQEIDWKKELLESGRFNNQFSKDLLENGAKNFMQGIYLCYMYSKLYVFQMEKDQGFR